MKQFTKKQSLKIYKSDIWKDMSNEEIVKLQLYQECICVPFKVFKDAIKSVLGRDVYTHEFTQPGLLKREYEGTRKN